VKTKEPKRHEGQWNVRSTGGEVRWITKINDTTYWFEGRSAAIRNGNNGDNHSVLLDSIMYVPIYS